MKGIEKKRNRSFFQYKGVLSLLLAFALCFAQPCFLFPVLAAPKEDNPGDVIHISTLSQLLTLAQDCATDTWSQGKTVILDKDIDLNGSLLTPIPTFGGIFLGQGHTIKGFSLQGGSNDTGLFRYIQESGEIHDLTVSGNAQADSAHSGLALLAGCNKGLISGCHTNGSVAGGDKAGSIAGVNDITGVITDCTSVGTVYGRHVIGGIAGLNKGSILNGCNYCPVNTTASENDINLSSLTVTDLLSTENAASVTDIGGIAGSNDGIIRACVNEGAVGYQHVGYNIGGIAGSQTGYMEGCVNYGILNGRKDVGGIAGQMEPSSELEFSEDTLKKLNTEFNTLHGLVNKLAEDAGGASDTLTGQISHLLTSVEAAQHAIDEISSQAAADITEFSKLTDLEALPSPKPVSLDFLDKLPSPSPSLEPTASPDASAAPTESASPDATASPVETATASPAETATASPAEAATPSAVPSVTTAATGTLSEKIPSGALVITTGSYTPKPLLAEPGASESPSPVLTAPEASESPSPSAGISLPSSLPDWFPTPSGHDFDIDRNDIENKINETQEHVYEDASQVLDGMKHTVQSQASILSARIVSAQSSLSSSFSGIISDMKLLNTLLSNENQVILDDFKAVSDELNVIGNIITNPETTDPEDIVADVSDEDTPADTAGKVMNCVNKGKVNGDLNLGGIAGSLSRENNLDPEDDLSIDRDSATLNFRYKERIVIRQCQNSGAVEGKKDNAGGIAGNMALGSIIGCTNSGSVTSDGDKIGGIAGYSASAVRTSSSKCSLSGGSEIGGICGLGKNISDCRSMIQIKKGENYLGSIAGNADSAADITGCYFVQGCPAGVDGISYTGHAEALSYDEFMTLPDLPDMFNSIYLTFTADEKTVAIITLEYGESPDLTALPEVPPKEGCSGSWEAFDSKAITFDQTINAVYHEYVNTLESSQKVNGRPLVLLEGTFDSSDSFVLTPINAYPEGAETLGECFKVTVNSSYTGPYTVRYLLPPEMDKPGIELFENNTWIPAEVVLDGSYFVFSCPGSGFVFSCVERPSADLGLTVSLLAASGILIAVVFWGGLRYKKNRTKKAGKKKPGDIDKK